MFSNSAHISVFFSALFLLVCICKSDAVENNPNTYPAINPDLPTLWLIGDSTVRNGHDIGDNGQWGWGNPIASYFDQTKMNVQNRAMGGTSSRTFRTGGLWDPVISQMKKGDYLIMQFGHNDTGPLDDDKRARGTLKGDGEESKEIFNPITKQKEVVHTYGWYLRQYVAEAKAKGATEIIICSPIARNSWKDGKIGHNTTHAVFAEEAAKKAGVEFIPLNDLICKRYDTEGEQKVTSTYFPDNEAVHTCWAGAVLNAQLVVEGINAIKTTTLKNYLLSTPPKDLKNPTGKPR